MSNFPPPSGRPSVFDGEPFTTLTRENVETAPPAPAPPRRSGGWRAVVAGGVAGAILGGGVAFATVKATDDDTASPPPAAVAQPNVVQPEVTVPPAVSGNGTTFDIQAVLAKVSPSVVSIET